MQTDLSGKGLSFGKDPNRTEALIAQLQDRLVELRQAQRLLDDLLQQWKDA